MVRFVESCVRIVSGNESPLAVLTKLEAAARICHGSEPHEDVESFLRRIIKMGHESILEHHSITVYVQCDRATAQQWTRHRIAAYSMQSQRYVDFTTQKHGGGDIAFVPPSFPPDRRDLFAIFEAACGAAEKSYAELRQAGVPPEDARAVLPNSTATVFYTTANIRQWRHFLKLRCSLQAQKPIRNLAADLKLLLLNTWPCLFDDC